MPFRAAFDCLWCGTPYATRGPHDVEGWAQLCPACIGRAGDNGFLRHRLRTALDDRGRARAAPDPGAPAFSGTQAPGIAEGLGRPAPGDEWYLRRGPFASDALGEATWTADLDAATLRIDAMDLRGRIVELEAGSGWWSPLLAGRGELWAHTSNDADLERVRQRLVAHGLRAHIHAGKPDLGAASADVVFAAFQLGGLGGGLGTMLLAIRRTLRPGGLLASIDLAATVGPAGSRASAGSAAETPLVPAPIDPDALGAAIAVAGFGSVEVERVGRTFIVAGATVAPDATRDGADGR